MRSVVFVVPLVGISSGRTTAQVETSGFQGEHCREATKFLDRLGDIRNEEIKDEMYETQGQHEHLSQEGGGGDG